MNLKLIAKSLKEASVYLRKHLNITEFPVYPVHNLFLRDFATEGDIEGHGAMNPKSHRNARRKFYKESLAWERGKHSFEYGLFMDIKDLAEATLAGFEFNNPLWNRTISGSGNLESIQFITKGSNKIVITSLKPYKNGYLMRAYEPQGMSARVQLSFGIPFAKIYKVNSKLEKITELKYENNELWYEFKPYEIVQFQLLK
jgi:alpha-mannosidase